MPTASINGFDLFYEIFGDGEPIILHHGYTGSHYNYHGSAAILAPKYRCILMDCRGAGDSGRPPSGHTTEQYAADVIALADYLGLDRFTFVGHSMGGLIGMELGITYGHRLNRLVLVAPAPADGVQTPPGYRERDRALHTSRDVETMLHERRITTARELSDDVHRLRIQRGHSVSDAHFEESWKALEDARLGERLAEITVPTLMVAGAADGLLPANLQDFQRLPNATLHVFSRVSHGVPYEVPEAFAEVIADFMEHGVVTARTLQEKLEAAAARA